METKSLIAKRIFVTGGHFTPAKATIEELLKKGQWGIYYIGRRYAMEDDKAEALEYREIQAIPGVKYLVITAGRLQPKFFVNVSQSIRALLKIPVGFCQALFWLLQFRPDVILSFGGYVAIPIVMWGWLLGIPILTHEQTLVSGKANKLIAYFADKILVSWPESLAQFPAKRTVLTGNPLRQEILELRRKPDKKYSAKNTIYIAGGNQGAHVINLAVAEVLPKLLARYHVIHQTGDAQEYHDFANLEVACQQLPPSMQKDYELHKFLDSHQVARALSRADLVVTRSGANIVTELLALGKPAILVPIPWSGNQEQLQNARYVQKAGLGEILSQHDLSGDTLGKLINTVISKLPDYRAKAAAAQQKIIPDAVSRIVAEVESLAAS